MKTIELKDFDELITALADLKQSVDKSFSRLISELNNMKRNVNDLPNKVSKLEVESEAVKTMSFISDLFKSVVSKLQLLMLEKNLSVTTLTKSRLEQVKRLFIDRNKEKHDEELRFIAEIIEKVSDEYQLKSLVTIDYLIKKKNRGEMVHYSRKIKEYALSTSSGDWNLMEFLSNQPELESHLFISEVKSLTLDSVSMESILRSGNYPNLTELKLFNFNKEIVSRYFIDDSFFGHICKQQITDLILIINENNTEITQQEYIANVYAIILRFFKNLKHLSFASSSANDYPSLSLYCLPRITFSSSTLTKLCIH
ncbi:unnamed protein product, partial [Rotaria magnacalcarata]